MWMSMKWISHANFQCDQILSQVKVIIWVQFTRIIFLKIVFVAMLTSFIVRNSLLEPSSMTPVKSSTSNGNLNPQKISIQSQLPQYGTQKSIIKDHLASRNSSHSELAQKDTTKLHTQHGNNVRPSSGWTASPAASLWNPYSSASSEDNMTRLLAHIRKIGMDIMYNYFYLSAISFTNILDFLSIHTTKFWRAYTFAFFMFQNFLIKK